MVSEVPEIASDVLAYVLAHSPGQWCLVELLRKPRIGWQGMGWGCRTIGTGVSMTRPTTQEASSAVHTTPT